MKPDILRLHSVFLFQLCVHDIARTRNPEKYFLHFKYKIYILYFVTFSGTSVLYFSLIHFFEGYFLFGINIRFNRFFPILMSALSQTCLCTYWNSPMAGYYIYIILYNAVPRKWKVKQHVMVMILGLRTTRMEPHFLWIELFVLVTNNLHRTTMSGSKIAQ